MCLFSFPFLTMERIKWEKRYGLVWARAGSETAGIIRRCWRRYLIVFVKVFLSVVLFFRSRQFASSPPKFFLSFEFLHFWVSSFFFFSNMMCLLLSDDAMYEINDPYTKKGTHDVSFFFPFSHNGENKMGEKIWFSLGARRLWDRWHHKTMLAGDT